MPLRTEGTVPLAVLPWALDEPHGVPACLGHVARDQRQAAQLRQALSRLLCRVGSGASAPSLFMTSASLALVKAEPASGLLVHVDFSAPHCVWGGVWGAVTHWVV